MTRIKKQIRVPEDLRGNERWLLILVRMGEVLRWQDQPTGRSVLRVPSNLRWLFYPWYPGHPWSKHFAAGISASLLSTCGDELSGSTLFARGAGRGRPDHLPSHPPHLARKDAVQLPDVPATHSA